MVHVFTHIVQIVVLASRTDTFLAIHCPFHAAHVAVRVHGALENGLELEE